MPASVQSPPTLRQFGKYLLDEEIARGGMARVFLARLRGLGGFEKKLVVKQVLPELASDPRFVEMFVEEAKTLVQMSHPHIVPVYELGVVDGVYFLAMEFVDGATLAEILREGRLSPALTADIGMQVCEALSYAHEQFELVHRDVTPRNVIVDALGHVRLLDFGIAAKAEGALEGEVFGSHGYMSPEQARGKIVDPSSDVFSLGTVLFEALTAEPAYLRRTPEQTRTALLDGEPPTLSGRDEIPKTLADLLDATLSKTPEGRPKTARAVARRLRAFLATDAPEGVAQELGARARSAIDLRKKRPSQRPPSMSGPTNPDGSVRTIATSVTLRKILGSPDTDPDEETLGTVPIVDDTAVTGRHVDQRTKTDADEDPQLRTMPIPGRTASQDGTIPIAEAPTDPDVIDEAAPPKDRRRMLTWLIVIGLGVAGVVGLRALSGTETTTATDAATTTVSDASAEVDGGVATDASGVTVADAGPATDAGAADAAATPDAARDVVEVAPPVASARISISANPWAEYWLDGRLLGTQAIRDYRITAGRHTLLIKNPDLPGDGVTRTFEARAGQQLVARINITAPDPQIALTER